MNYSMIRNLFLENRCCPYQFEYDPCCKIRVRDDEYYGKFVQDFYSSTCCDSNECILDLNDCVYCKESIPECSMKTNYYDITNSVLYPYVKFHPFLSSFSPGQVYVLTAVDFDVSNPVTIQSNSKVFALRKSGDTVSLSISSFDRDDVLFSIPNYDKEMYVSTAIEKTWFSSASITLTPDVGHGVPSGTVVLNVLLNKGRKFSGVQFKYETDASGIDFRFVTKKTPSYMHHKNTFVIMYRPHELQESGALMKIHLTNSTYFRIVDKVVSDDQFPTAKYIAR